MKKKTLLSLKLQTSGNNMKKLNKEEIKEQYMDLIEFEYCYDDFKKNTSLRDYFSKLFGTKFKAAFSTNTKEYNVQHGLDWSGDSIILITNTGNVVYMTNSEWASFQ